MRGMKLYPIALGAALILFVLQMAALFNAFSACGSGATAACLNSLEILNPAFLYLPSMFPTMPSVPTWVAFPILLALDIGIGFLIAWAVRVVKSLHAPGVENTA